MNLFNLIKEEYKNILKEVGDASAKSYDYKLIHKFENNEFVYGFVTDSNTKYEVDIVENLSKKFSKEGNFGIYIDFTANGLIRIENKGELYKVMATITNIIKKYIENSKRKIEFINIYTEGKRLNLYNAYLKKYNLKQIKDPDSDSIYYFFNNNGFLKESESDYKGEHEAPDREYGSPLHDVRDMFGKDFYDLSIDEIVRQFGSYNSYDRYLAQTIKMYQNKPNLKIKIYRAIPDFNKESKDRIKDLSTIINYYDKYRFYPTSYNNKRLNDIVYEYENIIKNTNPDIKYDDLQKEIYESLWKDMIELRSKKKKYEINPGDWVTIIRDYAVQHGKNELKNYTIISKTVYADEIYTEGYMEEWGYDPRTKSKSINEDYNLQDKEDIQSLVDIIDINPDSKKMDMYKDTLKNKYNYNYIKPEIRYKKEIEIVNKESNKKYTTTTNKGLIFNFITSKDNNLPRTIKIDMYNMDNEFIGKVGFNIDSFNNSIIIGGAEVNKEYRRMGIYNRVVDFIEKFANKYNLKIVEGSRSTDAKEFWRNRLNK
jgi:hypothetical protein